MVPTLPSLPVIPVWVWLLAILGLIGGVFLISLLEPDGDLVLLWVQRVLAGSLLALGLWMVAMAGRGLWRIWRVAREGVDGQAEVLRVFTESHRVKRSGMFATGYKYSTSHFIAYRVLGPVSAEYDRVWIGSEGPGGLKPGDRVDVRYLPDAPWIGRLSRVAPHIAPVMRVAQLIIGLGLTVFVAIELAPCTLWPG